MVATRPSPDASVDKWLPKPVWKNMAFLCSACVYPFLRRGQALSFIRRCDHLQAMEGKSEFVTTICLRKTLSASTSCAMGRARTARAASRSPWEKMANGEIQIILHYFQKAERDRRWAHFHAMDRQIVFEQRQQSRMDVRSFASVIVEKKWSSPQLHLLYRC